MFIIITLFIAIIILLIIMKKYKSTTTTNVAKHVSKEVAINEIYLSKAIQKHFYNLNKERLTLEEFQYIIDQQSDEQVIMFLNYMYERYYGTDTINMKCIAFSTLINDASIYSGYRLK